MPNRDPEKIREYNKEYKKNHRDEILAYLKEYRKDHQDEIKEYYQNHRDEILAYQKEYRKEHKDEILAIKTKYYMKHRDKLLAKHKEYYKGHKDEIIKQQKAYRNKYLATASGIHNKLKNNLRQRNQLYKLQISKEDFIKWYTSQEQKCFYCGRTLERIQDDDTQLKGNKRRLSIDRIDNDKGYELVNMVLACKRCNMIKNNFFTKDEMLKIVKMFPYKFK